MRQVKKERTFKRDLGLSLRHREWGWDVPVLDLDFVEYADGRPVSLIEYKLENAAERDFRHPSYQALIELGTRASLPVFEVTYAADFRWFIVIAMNDIAKWILPVRTKMAENEYVQFLYWIRDYVPPERFFEQETRWEDE